MTKLTYREAAARVKRSRRSIRRWHLNGMRMGWEVREGQRVRVVELSVLLAWWRQRLKNDPVHQQRLRAKRAAETAGQDSPEPISS
ncbi:hypothetical protein [Microbacterium sp. CFBP 8794]|uniref:hypothetical protein n=1 Tax=Microbacterium sp. CFBP 8794 TaxID=2775269 RepID=UPI001781F170|nr:hypothetical protein [Microbacterium sp. CFBP 8794]MBD8477584.1 hypothetical protein [Microbacterium sp. CFBP 8794]